MVDPIISAPTQSPNPYLPKPTTAPAPSSVSIQAQIQQQQKQATTAPAPQQQADQAKFQKDAQDAISKLSTTPKSQKDIDAAQSAFDKGYISKSDLTNYVNVANSNIASQQKYDTTMAYLSGAKKFPTYIISEGNSEYSNAVRDASGNIVGQSTHYFRLDNGMLFKSADAAKSYIANTLKGIPALTGEAVDIPGWTLQLLGLGKAKTPQEIHEEYWSQRTAKEKAAEASFGGTFSPEAMKIAAAPVGSVLNVEKAVKSGAVSGFTVENPLTQKTEYFLSKSDAQSRVDTINSQIQAQAKAQLPPQNLSDLTNFSSYKGDLASALKEKGITGTPLPKTIPLFDPVTGKPNIRFSDTLLPTTSEFKRDEKYGLLVREDIAQRQQAQREEKTIKESIPSSIISLSPTSLEIKKFGEDIAKSIRGTTIDTSKVSPVIKESTGFKAAEFAVPHVRESVARLVEFGGSVPATTELIGKSIVKEPTKVPEMVAIGGIVTVGGIARQIETDPVQFISDLLVSKKAFDLGGAIRKGTPDFVKFYGKEYLPPEKIIEPQVISGAERFPLAPRGTTPEQLIKEFKTSKYRIPGTEEKVGGWHATPQEFDTETRTLLGTSESPGMYIAPSTSPHFLKLSPSEIKLFGLGDEPSHPAAIFIETRGITRAPKSVSREFRTGEIEVPAKEGLGQQPTKIIYKAPAPIDFNKFLIEEAEKGKAFVSAAFEKGLKPEKEAIIPPDTPIKRTGFRYYTKWEGKKVPLYEYTTKVDELTNIAKTSEPKTIAELTETQRSAFEEYRGYKKPLITPSSLIGSNLDSILESTTESPKVSYIKSSIKTPVKVVESPVKSSVKSRVSTIESRPSIISSGSPSFVKSSITESPISSKKSSVLESPIESSINSIVNPIYSPIGSPSKPSYASSIFPRPFMDIFLSPPGTLYPSEEIIVYPSRKDEKDEGEKTRRKPKIQVKSKTIRHQISEIPDWWNIETKHKVVKGTRRDAFSFNQVLGGIGKPVNPVQRRENIYRETKKIHKVKRKAKKDDEKPFWEI